MCWKWWDNPYYKANHVLILFFSVLGLIISAIFVQYTSWRWVFWFPALMTTPIALACVIIVPPQPTRARGIQSQVSKLKSLDLVGMSLLTGPYFMDSSLEPPIGTISTSRSYLIHFCVDVWFYKGVEIPISLGSAH